MKVVKIELEFNIDENSERGKEILQEIKDSSIEDFKEDDEPGCEVKNYNYKISELCEK